MCAIIKREWTEAKKVSFQKDLARLHRRKRKGLLSESDVLSLAGKSMFSQSHTSSFRYSIYSGAQSTAFGMSTMGGRNSRMSKAQLRKIELKPSIQESMQITKDWWEGINELNQIHLPLQKVKKLFV